MTTMTDDSFTDNDVEIQQEALQQRVLLLSPTISWWRGMYQIPKDKIDVTSEGATVSEESVTTPRAKLITDRYPLDTNGAPWKRRFQKLESRLGALKERFSVPFPIQGVRIVPKARAGEMMDHLYGLTLGSLRRRESQARSDGNTMDAQEYQRMIDEALRVNGYDAPSDTPVYDATKGPDEQSIAYDLHMAAKEFAQSWASVRSQIADNNPMFHLVAEKVPPNSSWIRAKFALDVVPVELAGGGRGQEVTSNDLAEHADVVRETCRRRVAAAIDEMVQGPRQQLADALAALSELVQRDGRVTTKSFRPVREAINKIRMFDMVADDELMEQINQLELRLDSTNPRSLDSVTAANNGFTAAVASFMSQVQDEQSQATARTQFVRRALDLS